MPYQVKRNKCWCHPQTCCCDRYKIVDEKDNTYVTTNDKQKAQTIADALNLVCA
jgi:hypothetical protein